MLDREPDECDMLEESIIENELRSSLRPLELGRALERLQALRGGTLASIAASLHLSPASVTRATSLLLLPVRVQAMVDEGKLNGRVAYALSRLPDEASQVELAELAAAGRLSATACEEEVQKRIGRRPSKSRVAKVSVKEGDVCLTLTAPTREALAAGLDVLLKRLRTELKNGG